MNALNTDTIDTSTVNPAVGAAATGDNSKDRLSAIKAKMGDLGKKEGYSLGARRDAGLALCDGAFAGVLMEGDAEACYDSYMVASSKTIASKHLAIADTSTSRTAQISKFRAFIKLGMLPGVMGPEILARAVTIAEQVVAGGDKVLSPFEALRTVCVAQMASPEEALTDEELMKAVSKTSKVDKTDLEKACTAYKAARKFAENFPSSLTDLAANAYADYIIEQGGEVPAYSKEEKTEAAFMEKAQAMGFARKSDYNPKPAAYTTGADVEDAEIVGANLPAIN